MEQNTPKIWIFEVLNKEHLIKNFLFWMEWGCMSQVVFYVDTLLDQLTV